MGAFTNYYEQETILIQSRLLASLSLFILLAGGTLGAEHVRNSVPYFVDAAGTEYDLEQEARSSDIVRRLPRAVQHEATERNNFRQFNRWRIYLRSDGTWVPDPLRSREFYDYADRHYPVEYILPLGYRGTFEVVWGVRGASPLQIVDGKIEIYIPPAGIVKTSSVEAGGSGTVAAVERQFYFELDGKRTVIPHEPLQRNEVGIITGRCPEVPGRCYSYFVGSPEEWDVATAGPCRSSEKQLPFTASGQRCFDLPPGSTKPVFEIAQPKGKPAIMTNEFHGRALNGRRVVLSIDPAGINGWRYEGSEPRVPDESTLAAELKMYIQTTLPTEAHLPMEQGGCPPTVLKGLLRLSMAGPYRFLRTPYSSTIAAQFVVGDKSRSVSDCNRLVFGRDEQGWKLLSSDYVSRREPAFNLTTKIAEFSGKAIHHESVPAVLRRDGTWDSDDSSGFPPAFSDHVFTGYDMNGGEIEFAIDDQGRRTWRLKRKALQIQADAVVAELNHSLDRYIELLSAGNVKGFITESGGRGEGYEFYRILEKFGDESKEADAVYNLLKNTWHGPLPKEYGGSDFKKAFKKGLLEAVSKQVPMPSALQELKGLRREEPRIAPILFSQDFEALYTLPPRAPGQSQTIKRLTGRGARWTFDSETWNALEQH